MDIESIMLSQAWWLLGPSTLNRDDRYYGREPDDFVPFVLDYSSIGSDDQLKEYFELPESS